MPSTNSSSRNWNDWNPLPDSSRSRKELERRHRLEHVDLRDHYLQDREHALQGVERARRVPPLQERLQIVDLVQQLLEPKLVNLVDDDEEGLVVLRPVGDRPLERKELVELEIAGVGNRHRPVPQVNRGL
jgi:hypothetical protein